MAWQPFPGRHVWKSQSEYILPRAGWLAQAKLSPEMEMGQLAERLGVAGTRNKRQVYVFLRAWPNSLVLETPSVITGGLLLLSHLFLLHPVALLLIGLKGIHQAFSQFSYNGNYGLKCPHTYFSTSLPTAFLLATALGTALHLFSTGGIQAIAFKTYQHWHDFWFALIIFQEDWETRCFGG